jgi:hypothetical protein
VTGGDDAEAIFGDRMSSVLSHLSIMRYVEFRRRGDTSVATQFATMMVTGGG